MKLFHWETAKCLRLYSCGDIIVMADTLEAAKAAALAAGKTAVLGYTDMAETSAWAALYPDDTDEAERFSQCMKTLAADLEKPPRVLDGPAVIFVNGGE